MTTAAVFAPPHVLAILLAVVICAAPVARATTPIEELSFSPDVAVVLTGITVAPSYIAQDDLAETVTVLAIPGLPDSANIDAYHHLPGGDHLLSFDDAVTLPGGVTTMPADVVRFDGTDYTIIFNAAAAAVPPGANVDALTTAANGDLILSFDIALTLGAVAIDSRDLAAFDGAAFTVVVDGIAAGIPNGLDIDAAHRLDNGNYLLSFDGSGTIAAVSFDDEDVLELDPLITGWAMAYDGSAHHSGWTAANLDALSAVEGAAADTPTPTLSPTPTPTSPPACGDGTVDSGLPTFEACDDGNLTGGDGCESDCTYTGVAASVVAGTTVTTDTGAAGTSAGIPVHLSLTTPNAGALSIASAADAEVSAGIVVVGTRFRIAAPPASAAAPLVLLFVVDSSALPAGVDAGRLDVLKDGVLVANCTGAAGIAAPDPCIANRMVLGNGGAEIEVLTSSASVWGVVVRGLDRAGRKCVDGLNGAGVKVARAQAVLTAACLKAAAKGTEPAAQACLLADSDGKVAKAQAKSVDIDVDTCLPAPPFGHTGAATVNQAGQQEMLSLVADLFGPNLGSAVIPVVDRDGSNCQARVLRDSRKLFDTAARLFLKCKKSGLSGRTELIVAGAGVRSCFVEVNTDAKGRIARAVAKLAKAAGKGCVGVDRAAAFPGVCTAAPDLAACATRQARCRFCRLFNSMDGLAENCDAYDDGAVNTSCD